MILQKIQQLKEGQEISFDRQMMQSNKDFGTEALVRRFNEFALIIEGEALSYITSSTKLCQEFLRLVPEFKTVLCCRSTPNQKAEVVKLVKEHLKAVVLAVGDGGNDVPMIQLADVGVGILGKEGNQAANASDYAITRFRHLWRLLFLHGRWNNVRLSRFTLYFFYKNLILTFPQLWFSFYCGYSAQSIWEDYYLAMYNTIMTAWCTGCFVTCEIDVHYQDGPLLQRHMPDLYRQNRMNPQFTYGSMLQWFVMGVLHSLVIFYLSFWGYGPMVNSDGLVEGFWGPSMAGYFSVVFVALGLLFILTENWTWWVFFWYIPASLLAFFPIFVSLYDMFGSNPFQNSTYDLIGTPNFWLIVMANVTICLGPFYFFRNYQRLVHPDLLQILKSLSKVNKVGRDDVNILTLMEQLDSKTPENIIDYEIIKTNGVNKYISKETQGFQQNIILRQMLASNQAQDIGPQKVMPINHHESASQLISAARNLPPPGGSPEKALIHND